MLQAPRKAKSTPQLVYISHHGASSSTSLASNVSSPKSHQVAPVTLGRAKMTTTKVDHTHEHTRGISSSNTLSTTHTMPRTGLQRRESRRKMQHSRQAASTSILASTSPISQRQTRVQDALSEHLIADSVSKVHSRSTSTQDQRRPSPYTSLPLSKFATAHQLKGPAVDHVKELRAQKGRPALRARQATWPRVASTEEDSNTTSDIDDPPNFVTNSSTATREVDQLFKDIDDWTARAASRSAAAEEWQATWPRGAGAARQIADRLLESNSSLPAGQTANILIPEPSREVLDSPISLASDASDIENDARWKPRDGTSTTSSGKRQRKTVVKVEGLEAFNFWIT